MNKCLVGMILTGLAGSAIADNPTMGDQWQQQMRQQMLLQQQQQQEYTQLRMMIQQQQMLREMKAQNERANRQQLWFNLFPWGGR